jgi:hypothetical protein
MKISRIGTAIGIAAMAATSAANALSIYTSPATELGDPGGTVSVELYMDFGTTRAAGGQVLIDLTGPISFATVGFTPSTFFNSIIGGGSSYGSTESLPADAEFQVTLITPTTICNGAACPSLITGLQKLGDLNFDLGSTLSDVNVGIIDLSEGDGFGGRGDSFAQDLTGADLNIDFIDGTIAAVPLPASALLFATGFGLVGFWRRRRS